MSRDGGASCHHAWGRENEVMDEKQGVEWENAQKGRIVGDFR